MPKERLTAPVKAAAHYVVVEAVGLQGLAARVEALNGRLRVGSPPGRGTSVTAEFPLR